MSERQLISVIIPVYNVERYLRECIDSVTNQTYTELEIVLVDDGSTDSSAQICDEYALQDSRIKVLHKRNGGLSSARNAGLDIATGEFIGFVDSDDYISPDMYATLMSHFSDSHLGIVSCGVEFVNETDSPLDNISYFDPETPAKVTCDEYLDFYSKNLSVVPINNVWTKLYRRSLVSSLRFVEGRNNEDAYFSYHIADLIEKKGLDLLFIPDKLYFYRIRQNSISQTSKKPLYLDIIKNQWEIMDDCRSRNPQAYQRIKKSYVWHLTQCLHTICDNEYLYEAYFEDLKDYLGRTPLRFFTEDYRGLAKIKAYLNALLMRYSPSAFRKHSIRHHQ